MQQIAPQAHYQAGTLSGNPLAMVAISTLEHLTMEVYETINAATQKLIDGLVERAVGAGTVYAKITYAACSVCFSTLIAPTAMKMLRTQTSSASINSSTRCLMKASTWRLQPLKLALLAPAHR